MFKNKEINLIVAVTKNGAIGRNGGLACRSKTDMKYFKDKTLGSVVIMGRNTFESMGSRPLPERINFVVTSKVGKDSESLIFCDSIEKTLCQSVMDYPEKDIWIIGGEKVYRHCLDQGWVDKAYITEIDTVVEDASAWFDMEKLEKEGWALDKMTTTKDEESGISLKFFILKKENDKF